MTFAVSAGSSVYRKYVIRGAKESSNHCWVATAEREDVLESYAEGNLAIQV